jgi:hypothetical protein
MDSGDGDIGTFRCMKWLLHQMCRKCSGGNVEVNSVGGIVNKLGIWNPVVMDLYEVLIWVPSFPLPIQDDNGDNKACDCDLATS